MFGQIKAVQTLERSEAQLNEGNEYSLLFDHLF